MHTLTYLLVFVPGQTLCCQDKPVLFGATFHDADVVDGQPAAADHLEEMEEWEGRMEGWEDRLQAILEGGKQSRGGCT